MGARKDNDKKFGEAYAKMGKNRATQDRALARAVGGFNDALAKRSALEDARFRKTVKNISWGKELAWKQATAARKKFTMDIYGLTAAVKNQESRLTGEIAVVSAMVISNKAAQIRVNKRTKAEMDRVIRLADRRFSSSKRARGKLKELFNKNKIVAAQEIKDLRKSSDAKLKKLRAFMAQLRREAAKDLTSSTKKMYQRMAAQQAEQLNNHEKLSQSLRMAKVSTAAAVKSAKAEFASRFNTLVNTVTSNDKKYEKGLKHITGVAHDWKSKSAADRRNLQTEIKGMGADLNKAIGRAAQLGEARPRLSLTVPTSTCLLCVRLSSSRLRSVWSVWPTRSSRVCSRTVPPSPTTTSPLRATPVPPRTPLSPSSSVAVVRLCPPFVTSSRLSLSPLSSVPRLPRVSVLVPPSSTLPSAVASSLPSRSSPRSTAL